MLLIGPWYAQHASLASGAAQCDIVIAIYRISLSFARNELGNDPTARKQRRWRRRLDLICTSGQRRTNTLVARTHARWPLRASGVLDPLARTGLPSKKSRRASGPAGQRSMSRPGIIQNGSRDPNDGNVYFVTMQITFLMRKFRNLERNSHCDVV